MDTHTVYYLLDIVSPRGIVIFEEIHHCFTIRVLQVNVYS